MGKSMQSHENLLTPAQAVVLLACRSYFGVLSFIDVKAIQSIATQLPVNLAAGEPNRRRKKCAPILPADTRPARVRSRPHLARPLPHPFR
jgi:hypothetical protein